MHYVYMLRCRNGSLYTGWTTQLENRVKAHQLGKGAKYTRSFRPVQLVYYESYTSKQEALKREAAIKRLSKIEKERLVQTFGEQNPI